MEAGPDSNEFVLICKCITTNFSNRKGLLTGALPPVHQRGRAGRTSVYKMRGKWTCITSEPQDVSGISFHNEFLSWFSSCPRETSQEVECSYKERIKFFQKSQMVEHA